MKRGFLIVFFSILFIPFNLLASQSGWIEKNGYYKPYVKVKTGNCLVLFITEKGKIYRGKCRKRRLIVIPGKRFPSKNEKITFIVLKLDGVSYPEIVETGEIGR